MGLKKIGAMWNKQGQNGEFLSGQFEIENADGSKTKIDFLAFGNKKREGKRDPDWTINVRTDEGTPQPEQKSGGMFG